MGSRRRWVVFMAMQENHETHATEDFDLWKIDRNAEEETHQVEFALK